MTNKRKGKAMSHFGSCFCGAVKIEVTGSPEAMGYGSVEKLGVPAVRATSAQRWAWVSKG